MMSVLCRQMTVPTTVATPSVALSAPAEMAMSLKKMKRTAEVSVGQIKDIHGTLTLISCFYRRGRVCQRNP